ncbi:ATP-binding response regulator [Kordiimonas aestuarii]|uniref:ATP-binding response regulator n=1 Tax=Kordiimonas aestuarii TaxID=1005925 RepID=UPI0021D171B4|nr:ATP-binding protein [Kordiimonas aestuarii]
MGDNPTYDLKDVRVEQATLLRKRTVGSCLFVQFIIINYFIILYFVGYEQKAILWLCASSPMVGLVYLYGTRILPEGITHANVGAYLHGHILICCLTGALWSAFSIYLIDWSSYFTVFVACVLVFSITVGGMFPNSAYRPGYIGLAAFALLPLAFYILIFAEWPTRLLGFATFVYFGFGMITSARAELDMREAITARNSRELMEKVKAQNEIIRRVNEEKHRFLAATSHDLSQPIHAQGFFIQALRQHLKTAPQRELLDKIELTWLRQSQFLRGLTDVTHLDSGTIRANPSLVHLDREMQAVLDEFKDQAAQKQLRLTGQFDTIMGTTDPVLLNRIVRNLMANSLKYTPAGGAVTLGLTSTAQTAIITVADTGPGIPEADQKRIFDEYVQLGNGTAQDGVGLGLSIVKRLCQLLGIKLGLSSAPGQGTSFTLAMSLTRTAQTEDAYNGSARSASRFATAPLVVLVDDEEPIRDAMASLLTDWGCQVICGADADEVLGPVSATPEVPSLLIIDRMLGPGPDGIVLIERLREEVNEDTPAVLMSGAAVSATDQAHVPDMQFLAKPVDPAALHRILERVTSQTKVRR